MDFLRGSIRALVSIYVHCQNRTFIQFDMCSGLDSFLHLVSLEFMFSVTMCKNVNAYHDVFG